MRSGYWQFQFGKTEKKEKNFQLNLIRGNSVVLAPIRRKDQVTNFQGSSIYSDFNGLGNKAWASVEESPLSSLASHAVA